MRRGVPLCPRGVPEEQARTLERESGLYVAGVATAPGGIRLSCDFYYTYVCLAKSSSLGAGRLYSRDTIVCRFRFELGRWLR